MTSDTFTPTFELLPDGEHYEVVTSFELEGLVVYSGTRFNISAPKRLRRFKAIRQAKPLLLASCVHDHALAENFTWAEAAAYFYLGLRASGWRHLSACLLTGVVFMWGQRNHYRAPRLHEL